MCINISVQEKTELTRLVTMTVLEPERRMKKEKQNTQAQKNILPI